MPTASTIVTAAWTPPNTVEGFSGTAVEESSFIRLNWSASIEADVDFVKYTIYRRVAGDELWVPLVDIANKTVVEYEDQTAGQQVEYEYAITQYKAVVGDVPLESLSSEVVTIMLETDAWFTLRLQSGVYFAIEVNVVDENHNAVIQQEIFEPLALDRKRIVRGLTLGDEGVFTALFDVSLVNEARTHFELLNQLRGPHILKSPFGDIWFVEFDAPSFRYRPGGHLEVKIGWVEIQ